MTARHPLIEVISDDLENSSSELLEPTPVTTTCHIDSRTTSSSGGSNSHAAASVASSLRFPAPLVRSCDLATDSEWANARTDLSVCLEQLDAQLSSSSNSPCQANCSSVQPIQLVSRSVAEALFLIHSAIVPQLEPVVRAETPEAFQWTNAQLADTAARLEAHLLKAVRVESLDALFASGCEEDAPNRYLCALPALVRTQLSLPEPHTNATPSKAPDSSTLREPLRTERERSDRVPAWSYRPWLLVSLASLLSHVRFPSLRGAVLELALGTALNLLEVRSPSRLLGIQLARHALAECARAELRATGLAHALYAALTPLTFQTGDEPQQLALIRGLHAALIDTIRVLDPLPVLPPADLQLRVAAVLRECAGREQRARVDALLAFVDSELLRAADSTSEGSSGGGGGRTGRTPNVPDPRDPSSSCLTRFEYCVDRVLYLLRMEVKSSTCEALADALLGYVLAASPAAVTANRVPLADASCTFSVAGRRAIHPPSRPIGSIVPLAEPLLHTLELCLEHHSGSYPFPLRVPLLFCSYNVPIAIVYDL